MNVGCTTAAGEIVIPGADVAVLYQDIASGNITGVRIMTRIHRVIRRRRPNDDTTNRYIGGFTADGDMKHRGVC